MPGTFFARFEKTLRRSAGPGVVGGRLQATTAVILTDASFPAQTMVAQAPYELFGPGDVDRLAPGTITRRYPAPGAADAEETKLALVEFGAVQDLPWRYTPLVAGPGGLRPWLVLVVGRRTADEITVRDDGKVTIGRATQAQHNLDASALWAHVHEVDGRQIVRVVSPLNLEKQEEYVACVVKSFTDDGVKAWNGAAAVTLDCLDRWTFRTGPEGDFPSLAAQLRKANLAALTKPFGRAEVEYSSREEHDSTLLSTTGALRLPLDPPDPALPPEIAAEVTALSNRIVTPDGRGVVTAPRYEVPFTDPESAAPQPDTWIDVLRSDPRVRGRAGLGSWAAVEWQDRITDAAAAKTGDLAIAADRIRHVALGVEASRSLWRRRVETAASGGELLGVLAPVLGRLPATTGGTVLNGATRHTPDFTPALLSSAARRVLRPGPARTALAKAGASRYGDVLEVAATRCPEDTEDPADIPRRAGDPAIKEAVFEAAQGEDALAGEILNRLGDSPSLGLLAAALAALAPGPDGVPDPDAVRAFLQAGEFPDPDVSLTDWPAWIDEVAPRPPCRPIDINRLAGAVANSVNPHAARPPAVQRVLATLPGITHIGPVEIEPELDLPLWSFLSQRAPDWMLPGAGDLKEHDVVGLSTNPAFVQALLVGANVQTTGELRWRNIPMTSRWTPLRKFWQRPGGQFDIESIKGWPATESLGSTVLGGKRPEAVVAFRTVAVPPLPQHGRVPVPGSRQHLPRAQPEHPAGRGPGGPDVHRHDRSGHHVLRFRTGSGEAQGLLGGARGATRRLPLLPREFDPSGRRRDA